jgi:hypothetical protein
MATPGNTLITRADVTSVIDAVSGRKALVLDGQTLELGDTGWRDLSGSLNTLVTGRILVRRQANRVTWRFIAVVLAAGATTAQNLFNATADVLRDPFLPDSAEYAAVQSNATMTGRFSILTAGSPRLDYATVGAGYSGSVSFPVRGTGAWPSTLPGVADGQPVTV